MTHDDHDCGDHGNTPDDGDRRRGLEHLRVGIDIGDGKATIVSVWKVAQPVIQHREVLREIIARIDIAGRLAYLESFDDPRVVRGTYRKGAGHAYRQAASGTVYVSIPFVQLAELTTLTVRVIRRPKAHAGALDVATAATLVEHGAHPLIEFGITELRAHRDWIGVAGAAGVTEPVGRFEIYVDVGGEYRWRLRDPRDRIVAVSGEGFRTRAECERELSWVRTHAGSARVTSLDIPAPKQPGTTE